MPFAPMPTMRHPSFIFQPAKSAVDCLNKGDKEGALMHLYTAEKIAPTIPEYKSTIATILHDLGRYKEAVPWHKKAIAMKNARAEILSNYGNTLRALGDLQGAHEWHFRALKKDKFNSMILNNIGCVETELGDIPRALQYFDMAIAANPKDYNAYFNRGNAMLLSGDDSAEAWEYYDYRGLTDLATFQKLPFPWWTGENLNGKSIFIEVEQGAGDTFQFCRLLYALRDKYPDAKITFQVADPLYEIMRHNFQDICEVVPGEFVIKPPGFDYRLLLMHLARVFPEYISFTPYLKAKEPFRGTNGKFSVGLCWKGNPAHKNDHNRSISNPLMLCNLLNIPECQFFSLQKGEYITMPKYQTPVGTLACDEKYETTILPLNTWEQTFQVIDALDLIITVDTSIAHVAGALGRPVWLMVPKAPDWRWGLDGEKTKWYPSMKIFRQALRGDWKHVIENVRQELVDMVESGTPND